MTAHLSQLDLANRWNLESAHLGAMEVAQARTGFRQNRRINPLPPRGHRILSSEQTSVRCRLKGFRGNGPSEPANAAHALRHDAGIEGDQSIACTFRHRQAGCLRRDRSLQSKDRAMRSVARDNCSTAQYQPPDSDPRYQSSCKGRDVSTIASWRSLSPQQLRAAMAELSRNGSAVGCR